MRSRSNQALLALSAALLVGVIYAAQQLRQWWSPKFVLGGAELYKDNVLIVRTNLLNLAFAVEDARALPQRIQVQFYVNKKDAAHVTAPGWTRSEGGSFAIFEADRFQTTPTGERYKHLLPPFRIRMDEVEVFGLWANSKVDGKQFLDARVHLMLDENYSEGHFAGPAAEKILRNTTVNYNNRVLYSRPRRAKFVWETNQPPSRLTAQ